MNVGAEARDAFELDDVCRARYRKLWATQFNRSSHPQARMPIDGPGRTAVLFTCFLPRG